MLEAQRQQFIHKTVAFPFLDQTLHFQLSQSLFSSNSIDDGSRLLLKNASQQLKLSEVSSLLDLGCGVGVLGLCLKKAIPPIKLAVQDRDALALIFTQANAALNGINHLEVIPGLGLQNLENRTFDLILANLPGKAGLPVLESIVKAMPAFLSPDGSAGIVVVNPLAGTVVQALQTNGSQIFFQTSTAKYTILFFKEGRRTPIAEDPLDFYLRDRETFHEAGRDYELETVYNLPDFNQTGYGTRLALKLLDKTAVKGRLLFWNPGHGHLPAAALQIKNAPIEAISLGSRDALSIQISARNLCRQGGPPPTGHHLPTLQEMEGTFDTILLFPDFDPSVPWSQLLPSILARLLSSTGQVLLTAKSGFVGRLLASNNTFRPLRQKKYHGFRAVVLEKN